MKNWRDDMMCRMVYNAATRLMCKNIELTSYTIKNELSLSNEYRTPTPREIGNCIKRIDAFTFSGCVEIKNNKGNKYIVNKYILRPIE